MILPQGNLSSLTATQKAFQFLQSADAEQQEQARLKSLLGAEKYKEQLESILSNMNEDHYKKEQVGKLKERVQAAGDSNRKTNKIQQSEGVDRTAKVMGLIPYSKLKRKGGHESALKQG